jgi:signal transduction histidine kinase
VQDQGIGIPSEDLPHVFEPYRRGGNVGPTTLGSGIGLTSVRHIVEQHGGRVEVASRVGHGTTVLVWLPLQPAAATQSAPGQQMDAAAG